MTSTCTDKPSVCVRFWSRKAPGEQVEIQASEAKLSFGWRKLRLQNFRKVIESYYFGGHGHGIFVGEYCKNGWCANSWRSRRKQLSKESELVQFPVTSALYLPCWGLAFGNLQHSRYPSTWIGIAKCQVSSFSSNISNSMVCRKVPNVCGNMM